MTPMPPSPPAQSATKDKKKPQAAAKTKKKMMRFFTLDPVMVDVVPDEQAAGAKYAKLLRIVTLESIILAVLGLVLVMGTPFFRPVYRYYALNPRHQVLELVPLIMPNMTDRAILSWATTSITEIMTMGFGDFETKLLTQQPRFTPEGWKSFKKAFVEQKIGESFRESQLVLTTVPSDTPVIVSQGVNEQHVYQWRVQMPVIMTYATNNNVTRRERAIIDLTIIRVEPEQNPVGIGIATWSLKK